MKRFIYHLTPCLLIIVGIIMVSGPAKTNAVSASDWKAGRIIDDSVFTNSTSMTAQEVQNFLNARVPVCDTNGTQLTGRWYAAAGRYYTRAEWGALNGNPAPFTCLKDFWEVPKTDPAPGQPANNYGGAAIPAGAKSAAQIIWDAAQRYQISPKVLLTTIQKESYGPLTSDDWPYRSQYEYPMGAYCPDTAPCDPNYEGFSIQIYESARLFRYYLNNMGQSWWPYKKPNQVNSILYNPNSACGSSNVFIESSATAALYTYTPYQPNAAALANMYGTGDGCSAYGNRNFWRIFSDWFVTTYSGTAGQELYSIPHPTGSIVRDVNGGTIYKIIDGYRLIIPTYGVFVSQGYNDSRVKIMNKGDAALTIKNDTLGYRDSTLIRQIGDPKIYGLRCTNGFYSSCTKSHIDNYQTFIGYGYTDSDVINVAANDLNSIPSGPPISSVNAHISGSLVRDNQTNKIYIIKDTSRYHIPSNYLFIAQRFDPTKVKTMNTADYNLTIGANYPSFDTNMLVRSLSATKIYALGDNGFGTTYKRHIPNYDVFQILGYKDSDVLPLEDSLVSGFVEIPPGY